MRTLTLDWLPLGLLTFTLLGSACGDDVTGTDELGDSTSATDSTGSTDSDSTGSTDSDSTGSDSTSATDSTGATASTDGSDATSSSESTSDSTTGGGECNADDVIDVDITLDLIGSQAPADGCNDYTFTGTLEGGGGGVWTLDACPCGALCLIPDPYTVTAIMPDPALLPNMPACPKIEMRRGDDCEVVSLVVSDLVQTEKPVWIGSREDLDPGSVPELAVASQPFGVCECPDCDPPTLYDLQFDWLDASLTLAEGEQGVLAAEGGDWDVTSLNSHTREVAGTEHWAWVMKR